MRAIMLETYIHNNLLLLAMLVARQASHARPSRREFVESLATSRNARIELGELSQLPRPNHFGLARNIIPLLQGACPQAT